MTIKEMCRDDLIGRFASHTFTETVIGSTTKVEFKDGGSAVVAASTKLDVDDAYLNIRENMVGGAAVLFCLTTTEKEALTSVLEGQQLVDTTAGLQETRVASAWVASASAAALETVAITGDTTLSAVHNNKRLAVDKASDVTLTLDTGLVSGFNCEIEQVGVGQAQVSANGTTINSLGSVTKTSGQFAVASLAQSPTGTDVYTFSGDISS